MLQTHGLQIILTLIVAFLVSFSATPVVILYANKIGAIDIPKDNRRVHKRPTPRIGGLAIFYGFIVSALIFSEMIDRQLAGILIGSVIIVTVGIIDDIQGIRAVIKLLFQVLAAVVVVMSGTGIDFFGVPGFAGGLGFVTLADWASIIGTVIWIVAVTNALNLIDGLDGLAVGVSSIAALSLLLTLLVIPHPNVPFITFILAAAIAGSGFGFLPYNFNPAKIFMGDTGSTFLGFMLACVSVMGFFKTSALVTFAVPILILGLPIFDTGFAFLRRILKGQSPMTADRGHLHHRLLDMGLTQRQTVAILYTMAAVLSLSAVVMSVMPVQGTLRGILLILAVALIMLLGMNVRRERAAARLERRKSRELERKVVGDGVPDVPPEIGKENENEE